MPSKPSILEQISKWASSAENNLNSPNMPDVSDELRQKTLYDFSLLKLIANRATRDHKGNKGLNLIAGELASAVSSVGDLSHSESRKHKVRRTEILERMEDRIREEIRGLLNK
jgi:hypothetical protein